MKTAVLPLLFLLLAATARGQSALDGFDPNADHDIYALVVQPDGKILIGGGFTTLSPNGGAAVTRNHIARLNPDGTLDAAFNPNANNDVYTIAVQADGKILAGGVFGVPGALANPTLDLVNASGTVIRSNDNWKSDPQQRAAIEAAGLAPNHDEEAALVETVAPGAYTAIVRGKDRATGIGLVEAYNIP